jgi:hypothetical protein
MAFEGLKNMFSSMTGDITKTADSYLGGTRDLIFRKKTAPEIVPVALEATEKKFRVLGYSPDQDPAPMEYYARITSYRRKAIIIALLQSSINLSVDSLWEHFIPTDYGVEGWVDSAVQAATGGKVSMVSRASMRRKWKGSTPMEMTLALKFQAINSAKIDVVAPCQELQALALPSEGPATTELSSARSFWQALPFLSPPGPSPFSTEDILNINKNLVLKAKKEAILNTGRGGDLLFITLGNFVTFENVIVKKVIVEYDPRFDSEGQPVSATVNIVFDTYEMMTTESLDRAYTAPVLQSNDSFESRTRKTSGKRVYGA